MKLHEAFVQLVYLAFSILGCVVIVGVVASAIGLGKVILIKMGVL